MAKRTTTHNGRGRGRRGYSARHNDRDFDVTVTEHIAPELVATNVEWCIEEGATFDKAELHFYQEHFQEQLDATNEGYIANRHKERCKTMDEWRKLRQNAPEESLFQIGRRHDEKGNLVDQFVPGDVLLAVYQEFFDFQNEWSEAHGRPFTILNYAMHCDEPGAADHIHQRRVWHYTDEDGTLRVGQEKALEAAGVERPHPERYEGRYNNRKIAFDNMMREKWMDICEAHGIEVERTPVPGRRKRSKDLETYIREKNEALINENTALEKTAAAWESVIDREEEQAATAHQKVTEARQEVAELEGRVNTLETQNNALKERNEALMQKGGKIMKGLQEVAALQTVAEYQAQVIDNDKALASLEGAIQATVNQAQAEGCKPGAVRRIVQAFVGGLSGVIEALRIQITRVQFFERLHRIFEGAAGKRQEQSLNDILANATQRSEAQFQDESVRDDPTK